MLSVSNGKKPSKLKRQIAPVVLTDAPLLEVEDYQDLFMSECNPVPSLCALARDLRCRPMDPYDLSDVEEMACRRAV